MTGEISIKITMENLRLILSLLETNRSTFNSTYFIPEVWNAFEYSSYFKDPAREGQIGVDPYSFMSACIKDYILKRASETVECRQLPDPNGREVLNLGKDVIYCILPRMFTAWDHYREGEVISGTFLKGICLLPYLKQLKVNIIYLLPIFKHSDKYRKGELGSPYAIKNIYQIDPGLHDLLLGGDPELMVEIEFKAFVEACHLLQIRVMVDFAFRTVARDSDLIAEHPEWFYWIKLQNSYNFVPPTVETEKELTKVDDQSLHSLYTCKGIKDYLSWFTYSPPELDPQKWRQVLAEYHATKINILDLIEEAYQITTAPGFSNVLNDPQPLWTDVTYLKYYFDGNPKAKVYLPDEQRPYILQDIACLNQYRGTVPNQELWRYCLEIIPYYQEKYGIDGARIDMGHALPPELNQEIVARVKAKNNRFILWSEELSPDNSETVKKDGFHFISGNLWSIYQALDQPDFKDRLIQTLTSAALPLTAALETPDTPRIALVHRERQRISLLLFLNYLAPNVIPFINNGMELMEIQPMNLGLGNDEAGRFVLNKADPMYGKLAFFDNYCLHWLSPEQEWFRSKLQKALEIRSAFADLINDRSSFITDYGNFQNPKILFFCYYQRKTGRNLFFLANKDFGELQKVRMNDLFSEELRKDRHNLVWLYTDKPRTDFRSGLNCSSWLNPGEVLIGCLE